MKITARTLALTAALIFTLTTPGSSTPLSSQPASSGPDDAAIDWSVDPTGACCKVCKKGKACGNSCIARSKTCHQPPGCACDG